MTSSDGVSLHSGIHFDALSVTDRSPSSAAMPTNTSVKLLEAEKTSWVLSGPVSFQYHSSTRRPSRVTTRQFDPPASAAAATSASTAGSMPASSALTVSQSSPGKVPVEPGPAVTWDAGCSADDPTDASGWSSAAEDDGSEHPLAIRAAAQSSAAGAARSDLPWRDSSRCIPRVSHPRPGTSGHRRASGRRAGRLGSTNPTALGET